MSTAWFLEGRKTNEVVSLLRQELGSAFIAGLGFWPAVNLIIFKSVPVQWATRGVAVQSPAFHLDIMCISNIL